MNGMRIIPEHPCRIAASECICHRPGLADGGDCRMASEPDYRNIIADSNLRRRMGRLLKMSTACGLEALKGVAPENVAGIVTSTGMGFMADTVKFGNSMLDRNEELLNPSPFMQSTFNTASGYIALTGKIRASNTTYVQRAAGFASVFADAVMLLQENPGKSVLAGAFDEVTPEVDIVRRRLGYYRSDDGGFLPLGEGAGFFLLTSENLPDFHILAGIASASDSPEEFVRECGMSGDSDVNVVKCSAVADVYGAFMSMLPVVIADSLGTLSGPTLFVDDVNPDGIMALVF